MSHETPALEKHIAPKDENQHQYIANLLNTIEQLKNELKSKEEAIDRLNFKNDIKELTIEKQQKQIESLEKLNNIHVNLNLPIKNKASLIEKNESPDNSINTSPLSSKSTLFSNSPDLKRAIKFRNKNIVQNALNSGAEVTENSLSWAIENHCEKDVIDVLIEAGAQVTPAILDQAICTYDKYDLHPHDSMDNNIIFVLSFNLAEKGIKFQDSILLAKEKGEDKFVEIMESALSLSNFNNNHDKILNKMFVEDNIYFAANAGNNRKFI